MKHLIRSCRHTSIALVLTLFLLFANSGEVLGRPTVGVQRWDMYSGHAYLTQQQEIGYLPGAQGFLEPEQWHYRAPFFARKTEDVTWVNHPANAGSLWINYPYDNQFVQDTMDQEIDFAADAGIDYFIFNGPTYTLASNGWALHDNLDAYLASSKRDRINFTYALFGHEALDYGKSEVDLMLDEIIPFMQLPTWQTVEGNRPLVPVLWPMQFRDMLASQSGSEKMSLDEFVTHIRQRVMAAGLDNPYIVGEEISRVYDVSSELSAAGFDAMTDYAGAYGGALATSQEDPMPTYQQATQSMLQEYDNEFAPAALDFIPPVVNQHYPWPRQNGTNPVWSYHLAEPGDFSERIKLVFDYIEDHPEDTGAETIFMYSWNEFSEGGGLAPTMGQAPDYIPVTDHLDELSAVLNPNADFDEDNDIDGSDFLTWQRSFSQNADGWTAHSNGDSDGDGLVNSDDLLHWQSQFGSTPTSIASATTIPEPASYKLLATLLAFASSRHARYG